MLRALTTHMPIWVRLPTIIALVLAAVLVGAILLGAWDGSGGHRSGGGHGSDNRIETRDRTGDGRDHGSGGDTTRGDHGGGRDHGSRPETASRDHSG
jgi:hypothetical protein